MLPSPFQPVDEKHHIETASGGVAIEKRTRKRQLPEWVAFSAVLHIRTDS